MHPLGPQFEPHIGHNLFFQFLSVSEGIEVRILVKNGNFSTAVNSLETSLSVYNKLSYICPIKEEYRRVPEIA